MYAVMSYNFFASKTFYLPYVAFKEFLKGVSNKWKMPPTGNWTRDFCMEAWPPCQYTNSDALFFLQNLENTFDNISMLLSPVLPVEIGNNQQFF